MNKDKIRIGIGFTLFVVLVISLLTFTGRLIRKTNRETKEIQKRISESQKVVAEIPQPEKKDSLSDLKKSLEAYKPFKDNSANSAAGMKQVLQYNRDHPAEYEKWMRAQGLSEEEVRGGMERLPRRDSSNDSDAVKEFQRKCEESEREIDRETERNIDKLERGFKEDEERAKRF